MNNCHIQCTADIYIEYAVKKLKPFSFLFIFQSVCVVSSCHWSQGIAEAFVLCGVEVTQQLLVKLFWTYHLNHIVMDH